MVKNNSIKFSIRYYFPFEPLNITITGFRIFILMLVLMIASIISYLRLKNKDELEYLNTKQHQIEIKISKYLNDMSNVEIKSVRGEQLEERLSKYRIELKVVEKNIKEIKTIWFMK